MGANDVTRVVGRTTDQIAEERIARLNEALAARERERPVMTADKRSHWDDDRGTISAPNSDIPRDMTLVDFLKTGRNLRRGEYAKTFNTWLGVAGLLAGVKGNKAGSARGTKWYSDLSRRYGERQARRAADFVESRKFTDYFWQSNPAKVREDAATYAAVRDIINKLGGDPDAGRAVVGGSMSINKAGTLQRPTAVVHDLDIAGYTANASKVPWEPYPFPLNPKDPNGVAPGWYDKYVAPIENWRAAAEGAPILQRIRKAYPESHGNATIIPWDWGSMKMDNPEDRYKPGVFQQIGDGYSTSRTAGNNIFLGTRIKGIPVDLFLTDSRIDRIPGTAYAPPEVAFTWKNSYADDGGTMRPKDARDFLLFRRFSAANPVVNPLTKKAQFSPVNFGDRILTEEGLPAVYDVETWPGSGETVPMMMNTKGEMLYPFEQLPAREDAKGGNTRADNKGGTAAETFDTPIPEELRARYDAWYAQLPKNLQYTRDYDLQGAWLERLGRPDRYEATQNGHLDDYGKKPNHITFSTGSKWHDPKVPERAGGEWKQAEDGSWDFYPGTGNKASDDELKAYFDRYEKGNRVHRREVRQDAKGGNSPGPETEVSETAGSEPVPEGYRGPRIVINPTTFKNKKDALCVAFNEAFRVLMELNGFEPMAEPTAEQRRFFSDTAYAKDELQLRRTILARVATFDTSVKDPTPEQVDETLEFLHTVLEIGAPQNEWEQQSVQRLIDALGNQAGSSTPTTSSSRTTR